MGRNSSPTFTISLLLFLRVGSFCGAALSRSRRDRFDFTARSRSIEEADGELFADGTCRPLAAEDDVATAFDDNVPLLVGPAFDLKLDLQFAILTR